jgi:hypothetical protein
MAEIDTPADKRSWISLWRTNRVTMVFAALGFLAVLAIFSVVLHKAGAIDFDMITFFSAWDEAPIRVRNGSLDLVLVSGSQAWKESDGTGNWNIPKTRRYKDEFEVTVAVRTGATCGAQTATGSDVIFTYDNDRRIRLQSQGRHTWVKADSGVTLTADGTAPQKLSYATRGFIKSIAVGNGANPTTMCSFTAANQLDHAIILNAP